MSEIKNILISRTDLTENHENSEGECVRHFEIRYWNDKSYNSPISKSRLVFAISKSRPVFADQLFFCTLVEARNAITEISKRWNDIELYDVKRKQVAIHHKETKIEKEPLIHKNKAFISETPLRNSPEERWEYCTFLTINFKDFDCEDSFFYRCLFKNCSFKKEMNTCLNDCTIVGCHKDDIQDDIAGFRVMYGTNSIKESKLAIFCDSYKEAIEIAVSLCKEHEYVRIKHNDSNETLFNKSERNENGLT